MGVVTEASGGCTLDPWSGGDFKGALVPSSVTPFIVVGSNSCETINLWGLTSRLKLPLISRVFGETRPIL